VDLRRAALVLAAAGAAAACASLADRFERGSAALSTPFGIAYLVLMSPILQDALNACLPSGDPPPSPRIVIVADILESGKARAVDVRPRAAGTRCVAARFESAVFPRPPLAAGEESFPIGIRVDLEKTAP